MSERPTIKITADDLAHVSVAQPATAVPAPALPPAQPGHKHYGSIHAEPEVPATDQKKRNILLEGWFYLGVAGFAGAVVGWAICEPGFTDGRPHTWGNSWMVPSVVTAICIGFALAESIVERSLRKALARTALALPLGVILAFFLEIFANLVYAIGLSISAELGAVTHRNPMAWIARGLGWTVFGVAGGSVYGILGQSAKRAKYGILGGILGAGLGGLVFDPISMPFHGSGRLSRVIGFALFGFFTGAAMGLVESALKDRWLYVYGGPLAGKQFILYKPTTSIGSRQQCDIYLFKDASILPDHALLVGQGNRIHLRAAGPVYVAGQPTQSRVLQNGDVIQIGRYAFRYQERLRSS